MHFNIAYYYRQLLLMYVDSRYAIHTFLLAGAESVPQLTGTTVAGYRCSPLGGVHRPFIRSTTHAPGQTR
jgi:hypothetical protein